jgi:hypothetical protein
VDVFDKKQIFDRLCKDENPMVDELFESNQSVRLILSCGCGLVYHKFFKRPSEKLEKEDPERYERVWVNRAFGVELCNKHSYNKF